MAMDQDADEEAKVVSLHEARNARKPVFTLTHIDDDIEVEQLVWITEGVQESAGQTRIAVEGPTDSESCGWALTPSQARRIAVALIDAAQQALSEGGG
jgi:hypothetical protein